MSVIRTVVAKLEKLHRCHNAGMVYDCFPVFLFLGEYDILDAHFHALLFPSLGVSSRSREYDVGEQRYSGGVYDLEFFHPFEPSTASAVRQKFLAVGGIQITIYGLKEGLGTAGLASERVDRRGMVVTPK